MTLPDRIREAFPGASVLSLGGATEASIWSIAQPDRPRGSEELEGHPLRQAAREPAVYAARRAMEPVSRRGARAPYIGGLGLARGYWRDEERTRERFVTHPETGERLYWTGDAGRCLPDGNIEFLGREDFQVKIQGHRIELEEIEAALLQHPDVASAAVSVGGARRAVESGSSPMAVPAPGRALEAPALRAFIASKLPDYMVPSALRGGAPPPPSPATARSIAAPFRIQRGARRGRAGQRRRRDTAADPGLAPGIEALLAAPERPQQRGGARRGRARRLVAYVTTWRARRTRVPLACRIRSRS